MPIHLLKRLAVGLTLWALLVPLGEAGLNVVPDLGGSAARAAEQQECSFPITRARELAFREITERHHISCAEAKRVLRKLRGNRDMIPMSCVRTFRRQGWLIQNSNADHVSVSARYGTARSGSRTPDRNRLTTRGASGHRAGRTATTTANASRPLDGPRISISGLRAARSKCPGAPQGLHSFPNPPVAGLPPPWVSLPSANVAGVRFRRSASSSLGR